MNKSLPHLFTFFSALCLSVPAYTADGEWGVGTPTTRRGTPQRDWTGTSAATSSAPSPLSSSSSWGSAPRLKDQPELERLRLETDELPRSFGEKDKAAPAASHEEPFNPYTHPVLSFRWISLLNGYPDPTSTNYDSRTRQYYDASTGIFPSKQPPSSSLKNQIGPEVKAWEAQVRTDREAYMAAYRDWQHKQKRYHRKLTEDLSSAVQQLGALTDSLFIAGPQDASKSSPIGESGKEAKNAEILQRAKIDAEQAEGTFKKLQKLLIALHPTECKIVGDERQLSFLTAEEFERRFIWGFVEKPLVTPYKTLPGQRLDPNNVKGLLLTDPVDIRIGIHILSWMVLHLKREYEILVDIRTRYKRDFVPKVTGLFSPTTWSDWYYSTSAGGLKDQLKRDYPSSSIAHFHEPKTDQEETLRLLRRDNLGLKLRSAYLDHIKRYQEVESQDLSGSFFKIYQGLDHVSNVDRQTTHTINKSGEQRTFPKPLSTPFLSIQTRLQPAVFEGGDAISDTVMPFVIPKKAQMAVEYVSPKAMGFHRNLWPSVMNELRIQGKNILKSASFSLEGAAEYARLYSRYESAVQNIRLYLKALQTADSFSIPTPFEFFFMAPPLPKQLAPETVVDLEEFGITDQDLSNLRLLPGAKSEPILHRYAKIGLARNTLQSPTPAAFGPSLTSLDVSQNQLNNLEFAVPLTGLTELDVSDQILHSLSPFGNEGVAPLPKLERFILAHTGLGQIGPLASFSSLRTLDLSRNDLVTVAPLKDLKTLEELNLAQNKITDIVDLESLYRLRELNVSGNSVKDLKPIVKLEALQLLIANQCNFNGSWLTFLPVATNDADPRPKALTHLLLKGNEKLEWTPYQAKRSYSSSDVSSNNSAFNTSFPALRVLEVGINAKLEAAADKPITLRNLCKS